MLKITANIISGALLLMLFSSSAVLAAEKTESQNLDLSATSSVGVAYRGHIEYKGNVPLNGSWMQGPEELGTVGEGLRLEAFWIRLSDAPEGLHIQYDVHVQNKGWLDPVQDGEMAGTNSEGLRIEAIKIKLVDDAGKESQDYDVFYRGHIQNYGDTNWFSNGNVLGTTGSGLRLEALKIKIEKKPADLLAYQAALAAVTEEDYTIESWDAYQNVINAHVMTSENLQSEVDAATAAIISAQQELKVVDVITEEPEAFFKTIDSPTSATNLNYQDILNVTLAAAGKDPVLHGITLTKPTAYPIRVNLGAGAGNQGDIYMDKDADGTYDVDERVVGSFEIALTGRFTNDPSPASVDIDTGIDIESGDEGTVLFKLYNTTGGVVGIREVNVDF